VGGNSNRESNQVDIDVMKSWWLALDATSLEPHGRSKYLGAPFEVWKDRTNLKRLRRLFIQRFALGGGVAHVPETIINEFGERIDVFEATGAAYNSLTSGGLLLLPNDRVQLESGEGSYIYDFTASSLEVRSADPITGTLTAMDAEQLIAFGFPPKTIMEGQAAGSFAMLSQQMKILFAVIEDVMDQLVESFQEFVMDKTVEVNWIKSEAPKMTLTYSRLSDHPDDMAVKIVQQWLTSASLSEIASSGAIDVRKMLENVGIPLTDDAEARITALLQSAQQSAKNAAQPPPPGNGQPPGSSLPQPGEGRIEGNAGGSLLPPELLAAIQSGNEGIGGLGN
jgi:hypothetical protein